MESIAIDAASAVVTQHRWAEDFSDWCQRPRLRVIPIKSTVSCLCLKLAFKLDDIDCGLTRKGMDIIRSTCPRHTAKEWIPFRLLAQIFGGNRSGAQLRSDLEATAGHRTEDDGNNETFKQTFAFQDMYLWNAKIQFNYVISSRNKMTHSDEI